MSHVANLKKLARAAELRSSNIPMAASRSSAVWSYALVARQSPHDGLCRRRQRRADPHHGQAGHQSGHERQSMTGQVKPRLSAGAMPDRPHPNHPRKTMKKPELSVEGLTVSP